MTNETVTRIIWQHEVEVTAIGRGANGEWIRSRFPHSRMGIWYNAGETISGAVDMIMFCWKHEPIEMRADREKAFLRTMLTKSTPKASR